MLLSVIVPVFNGEKYLEECLLSLINQTNDGKLSVENYEIIVVNDGSTDGTEQIIDTFSQKYPFIKKFNKDNGGVSETRNLGIEIAQGEYVTFLDADDKIATNIYSTILECIAEKNLDGYHFSTLSTNMDSDYNIDVSNIKQDTTIKQPDDFWGIHGAVYKRSILKNKEIFFDTKMSYQEDLLFSFHYLQNVKRIGKTALPLYIYRKNDESVTSNLFKRKTAYGDIKTKEYRCYTSRLRFLIAIKEYLKIDPENCLSKKLLSIMTAECLWFAMKSLYPPNIVLKDIKKNKLSLKDIKIKYIADVKGNRLKAYFVRCLKWSFKNPVLYTIFCKTYQLMKNIKGYK